MDKLGRFYTQDNFSKLLVRSININQPNTILELGAGEGSLLKAAANRWKNADIIAADIDTKSIKKITTFHPRVNIYKTNGLRINIENSLSVEKNSIDVAICNPPFLHVKNKNQYRQLFIDAGLSSCTLLRKITSDVVFLAQNFKLLRLGGELGIILPDTILSGEEFIHVRNSIMSQHCVKAVIELPRNIFPKTEAKTHIVIIEKGNSTLASVPLFIADKKGNCYDNIDVSSSELEMRMDFSYHKSIRKVKTLTTLRKLGQFEHKIMRGNINSAELKTARFEYIHSTSFHNNEKIKIKTAHKPNEQKYIYAQKGDVVIVRVGRGCVGKVARVTTGYAPVSDCVFVVRASKKVVDGLWRFIKSEEGGAWLKSRSHGTCAKLLTKNDIKECPIII